MNNDHIFVYKYTSAEILCERGITDDNTNAGDVK